ncbi:PTS sugar transporter subunit IIA [Breznakia pachnodae]|uniref:PTS system galactitol-specific IIA component n=1 Tax=Breznakia pachnodae TaxID=265178 RepID=A0ABU0E6C9_9FIRM|nr:PTS sugar transporter subunit IIA [Breznakia pachnodae]MDQ0362454.1 PTS system galactitol-specific IIA component [Breznakia pachnodae]
MITDYLDESLIWLQREYHNRDQLFYDCAEKLYKEGFVEKDYYHALTKRENEFPTGLDMEEYAVAIPHANPDVIKKDFIVALTLKKPVKMRKMDDASTEVDVKTFFLLGLKESNSHLVVLREFINMIQCKEVIDIIEKTNSTAAIVEVIEEYCNKEDKN